MGRVVRNSQIRFDGKELKTDKVYNVKTGLLERESQPTTDEVPIHWNTYSYDSFFRQTSINYASGKVDSCAYGILTDTIIENGITWKDDKSNRCGWKCGILLSSGWSADSSCSSR